MTRSHCLALPARPGTNTSSVDPRFFLPMGRITLPVRPSGVPCRPVAKASPLEMSFMILATQQPGHNSKKKWKKQADRHRGQGASYPNREDRPGPYFPDLGNLVPGRAFIVAENMLDKEPLLL